MSSSPLLRAEGLSFSFVGHPVLRDVSFSAAGGEFLAVLGANGAGKSTLLDLLAGLRNPQSGSIAWSGIPLPELSPSQRARILCHLPQGVRADLPFSVEQMVLMGRYHRAEAWLESDSDLAAVDEALRRTDCWELRHRRFSRLSGGERQRALLAACFAQQASILLMDEPSTFLDLYQQLHCFQMLREEADGGALCIAVTHDLNLALAHCTRLLVLRDHTIGADLPVDKAWTDREWLHWFSPNLRVETSRDGASWVAYRR
jgi:iron complex transport system ATP-binding protein